MTRSEETEHRAAVNRAAWDARTRVHLGSAFYDVKRFREGASTLKAPELELAGPIAGRRLLHLQCHFGLDTLSWARLGADATGVDLSPVSINAARALARELGIRASFVCADAQDLPPFEPRFDLVLCTYGVLCWLEDLDAWARGIRASLVPRGRMILVEFHPMLEVFHAGSVSGAESYFPDPNHRKVESTGTYADREAPITYSEYRWQHPVGQVVSTLLGAGLTLLSMHEYEHCSFPIVDELGPGTDGTWVPREGKARYPYMYSLVAEASP